MSDTISFRTANELKELYGGLDSLYSAMIGGTIKAEDLEDVWTKCAGTKWAIWVRKNNMGIKAVETVKATKGIEEKTRKHLLTILAEYVL